VFSLLKLNRLTEEQRLRVAELLTLGHGVKAVHARFYDEHPDHENPYNLQSFYHYARSPLFQEDKKVIHERIKELTPEMPLVLRGSRISLLTENLQELQQRFLLCQETGLEYPTRDLVSLHSEIRQTIRDIREEAAPFDSDAIETAGAFQQFMENLGQIEQNLPEIVIMEPIVPQATFTPKKDIDN